MALRLLPLSDEYQMAALKDQCERLLVGVLKKTPMSNRASKGPPTLKNRRDNTPEILLKCIRAADQGNSKVLLDQCIKMFSNPEIALKDLKSTNDISDTTKSKIFETRMDAASNKLSRMANELDREKHEKEMLKKQLSDRFVKKNPTPRYGPEPTIEKPPPSPVNVTTRQNHHYFTHQRYKIINFIYFYKLIHWHIPHSYRLGSSWGKISYGFVLLIGPFWSLQMGEISSLMVKKTIFS